MIKKKEKRNVALKSDKGSISFWGIFTFVLCLFIIVFVLILYFDIGEIEFIDGTYSNQTVEFGEEIPKQNIKAVYKSRILHRKGIEVPVVIENKQITHLGDIEIGFYGEYKDIKKYGSYVLSVVDTKKPILNIDRNTLEYSCMDNYDGDITDKVVKTVEKEGVVFMVSDSSGNLEIVKISKDVKAPEIVLGEGLLDFKCIDNVDGDITDKVVYYESNGIMHYEVCDSSNNFSEVEKKIEGENKVVYLTYDDGPSSYTTELLDVLKKYNAKATFFVVGTSAYLDILPRMVEEGHTVAAHTYSHEYSKLYPSVEAYFSDLNKVEDKIFEQIGAYTNLVRFPGGSSNTISKKYCKGVITDIAKELENKGYVYFDWNVLSGDAGETTKTEVVKENIIKGIESNNVSVVLQHDIKGFSVKAVEDVLKWGTERGYLFLPLSEQSSTAHHKINN